MVSNLKVNDILDILGYAKPLFKLYVNYIRVVPENLNVFKDIANGDFEKVLKFIYGNSILKQNEIKVASIGGSFSNFFIKHEFDLIEISPNDWKSQFECKKPDLFICESAYDGEIYSQNLYKCGVYNFKLVNKGEISPLIEDILDYCNLNNIPTIFWNNVEDSVQNDSKIDYIITALHFDYIFTNREESVEHYKNKGINNVSPLMFAAQPKLFNPIKTDREEGAVIFVDSENFKFHQTSDTLSKIFDKILNADLNLKIYDLSFNSSKESKKYPKVYQSYVSEGCGNLDLSKIYHEAEFGLIFNKVTDSATQFNRNVFELMASNTVVLSNYSKGIYRIFKNNVLYLDRRDFNFDVDFNKIKEENLYNILENHTCSNRFREMLNAINFKFIPDLKHIVIFYRLDELEDFIKIQNHFHSIGYPYKHLILITDEENLFLSGSVLDTDLENIQLNDNDYFVFADLNLNPTFVKKALLHFSYIGEDIGICENSEDKCCFGKTKDISNVIFNNNKFSDMFSNDEVHNIYYI